MDRQIHSDVTGEFLRIERGEEPECGKDFCDRCGDCLECYGGDDCVQSNDGHLWVRYDSPKGREVRGERSERREANNY